jgi:hypothetical protein
MPTCKNGSGSYTGKEPSPKGRGYCARHEKIGTKKRGRDKKMWVVKSVKLASGKRSRRWFKVLPPAKKSKAKPTKRKRPTTKRKTKRLKGGVGYNLMRDPVNHPRANLETRLQAYMDKSCDLWATRSNLIDKHEPIGEVDRFQADLDKKMQEAVGPFKMKYFRQAAAALYRARHDNKGAYEPNEVINGMDGRANIVDIAKKYKQKIEDAIKDRRLKKLRSTWQGEDI